MLLKQKTFNHTSSNFREGLNVPSHIMSSAIEKIIFSTAVNAIAANEMYESRDAAPQELTTVTGDLQKTLSLVNEGLEYEIVLLSFRHYHELTQKAVEHYMFIHSKEANEKQAELVKKITKFLMIKEVLEDDENDDPNNITFKKMLKRISFVKKSNYNFDRYIKYVSDYNSDIYLEKMVDDEDQD